MKSAPEPKREQPPSLIGAAYALFLTALKRAAERKPSTTTKKGSKP